MEFIGPRADGNCPSVARAIKFSPRADKFQIARPIMLFLVNRIPKKHPVRNNAVLYCIHATIFHRFLTSGKILIKIRTTGRFIAMFCFCLIFSSRNIFRSQHNTTTHRIAHNKFPRALILKSNLAGASIVWSKSFYSKQ